VLSVGNPISRRRPPPRVEPTEASADASLFAVDGSRLLKEAVVAKLKGDNALDYRPDQVLISNGAKQSCYNACLALLDPGDEVIIPAPYWVSYPDMVRLADAEPAILQAPAEHGFRIGAEQLTAAITPKTRLVIFNSPCNPTGGVYSRADWLELGAVLRDHPRIVILTDDIYEHIYWADKPFTSFAEARPPALRSHDHRQRDVEVLRDERLAHRLRRGAPVRDQGNDEHSEPEHDERLHDLASGCARGPRRRPERRRCDVLGIQASSRRRAPTRPE
jgi:aspartate/methionine/tyrosine aminotransferase